MNRSYLSILKTLIVCYQKQLGTSLLVVNTVHDNSVQQGKDENWK